jgi:heme-degrading monooxygenase HmoA
MIARIWHGRTNATDADEYLDYLHRTGIPDYQATPGNQGVYVLSNTEGEVSDFILISLWESREAIKGFTGEDIEKASYYPEDESCLIEFEENVKHCDVLFSSVSNLT